MHPAPPRRGFLFLQVFLFTSCIIRIIYVSLNCNKKQRDMKFKAERYYTKKTVNGISIYGIRMGYYDRAYKWVVVKDGMQVSEFWTQKEAAAFAKAQKND